MAEKSVISEPLDWWWIVIAGISALMELINPVFVKVQAPNGKPFHIYSILIIGSLVDRDLYNY